MTKMKKKTITILLVTAMLIGILAGCTGTSTGNTANNTVNTKTNTKTATTVENTTSNFNETGYPVVNEPITITAVGFRNPATEGDPKELSYWKVLEKITNIHIDWTLIDSALDGAAALFFAAGNYPDLFHNGVSAEYQLTYGVEGGIFADLSEYIYKYCPYMVKLFDKFPTAEKVIKQVNGEVYTLPRIQVSSTAGQGVIYYRSDYIEKVGLKEPSTLDEFYNALVAIKKAGLTKGKGPLIPSNPLHINSRIESFIFSAFGNSIDSKFSDAGDGRTVIYSPITEQYRLYLEFMHKLYTEQLFDNEYLTMDSSVASARIDAGEAAFFTGPGSMSTASFDDGQYHLDVLSPLTSQYRDTKKIKAYDFVTTIGGAINKNCKYIKEIMRMVDLNYCEDFYEDTGFNSMSQNLGIYDVDWRYLNNEHTAFELIVPNDWSGNAWTYKALHGSWGQYYSYYNAKNMIADKEKDPLNYYIQTGITTKNMPFAVDGFPDNTLKYTAEESETLATKFTDIDTYVEQMKAKFISGIEPFSNWDSYVATVKNMGIADVIAVKQAAYDRWNK